MWPCLKTKTKAIMFRESLYVDKSIQRLGPCTFLFNKYSSINNFVVHKTFIKHDATLLMCILLGQTRGLKIH